MIHNFIPEFLLLIYILCAMLVKALYNKKIDNSVILLLAFFSCFISGELSVKSDFFAYKYYESLLKSALLFSGFIVCHSVRDCDFEKQLLIIFSSLGAIIILSANDFLSLIFAIELAAIPTYFLAFEDNFTCENKVHSYFVYGIISSAIFVFAISVIYFLTDSTNFGDVRYAFSFTSDYNKVAYFPLILILISFSIKLGIFLCHTWVLEIVEKNSSQIIMIFCSFKIAIFIAFYKVITNTFYHLNTTDLMLVMACLSMVCGSVMLAFQNNIKKIIAYSTVYHAGVVMMCCAFKTYRSAQGIVFLSLSELVALLGIFVLLSQVKKTKNQEIEKISDLNSLSQEHPALSIAITALFMSLAGLPPFIGFMSKFYICLASIENGCILPAAIYIIATAFSLVYIVKIAHAIWFKEGNGTLLIFNQKTSRVIHLIAIMAIIAIPFAYKVSSILKTEVYFVR